MNKNLTFAQKIAVREVKRVIADTIDIMEPQARDQIDNGNNTKVIYMTVGDINRLFYAIDLIIKELE